MPINQEMNNRRQAKEMSYFCLLAELVYMVSDYDNVVMRIVEYAAGLRVKIPGKIWCSRPSLPVLKFNWAKNATRAMLWQKFQVPKFKKYAKGQALAIAKQGLAWAEDNAKFSQWKKKRAKNL